MQPWQRLVVRVKGTEYRIDVWPDVACRGGAKGPGTHVAVRDGATGRLIGGYQGPVSVPRIAGLINRRDKTVRG